MTSHRPIEDYALLSDCRSAALVTSGGTIEWLCFPRFDSPAIFAALLGDEHDGAWSLAPTEVHSTERRYLPDTKVLETIHYTDGGSVLVTDALIPNGDTHRLIRLVRGREGTVEMATRLRVRFDYGSIVPWVRSLDGGINAIGGPDGVVVRTNTELHGEDFSTVGEFAVSEDEEVWFDLAWHPSHTPLPDPVDVHDALHTATEFWESWTNQVTYHGKYHTEVRDSLTVLKALTYDPTGGIVAAPTTSLPEWLGGPRNWDYRYCWLRDATFTLLSLIEGGCIDEAKHWRDWLIRAVAGDPSTLQIMYGVAGERRLPEYELDWLDGFADSKPVRIGNGAVDQLQIDVVGEVMDAMHQARRHGLEPDENAWHIQRSMLGWLADHWRDPDAGIWEVRSGVDHFVHSKVMAWVAFDRGAYAVENHGLPGDAEAWRAIADEIHDEVCTKGVDDRGVFTQAYGSSALDASALVIPLVGFLPPDDDRVAATVDAIMDELSVDGLTRRYLVDQTDDGVDGEEGAFLLCSFWLVDVLATMGRTEEATEIFEHLLDLRNDVGLLAEEYDPVAGHQLGNFPQAFSHIALVSSAMTLCPDTRGPSERREERSTRKPGVAALRVVATLDGVTRSLPAAASAAPAPPDG